ncbi:hypothetical protein G6F46_005546 [Rhizopus delemar]|uniref:Uncharacterized protein n=2 Tax=Rhizopus TaxID=4842 RepID=A0A9P7CV44_9FUNG|nr:hypothetical protein G6F55_000583 [Rhizopus delemar]KAG1554166.1 hypothetical protein G6F51_000127 [Rhizopus arrhizus]KAG1504176.1 hypothetical protein G6F54_001186 [Rhizopus delemar]KAG1518684.1 hypothetical protein G6F53_000386 [Rhizopus delemar]KAG1529133.1 hypothetical protein G6F52_000015 [Rhizopus delemar]
MGNPLLNNVEFKQLGKKTDSQEQTKTFGVDVSSRKLAAGRHHFANVSSDKVKSTNIFTEFEGDNKGRLNQGKAAI